MSNEKLYHSEIVSDGSLDVTGWATVQLLPQQVYWLIDSGLTWLLAWGQLIFREAEDLVLARRAL